MTVHEIDGWTIHTEHDFPPIPLRSFDWSACLSDYEPGDPVGHGRTEDAAIADLLRELEEDAAGYDADEAADMRRNERDEIK